MVYKCGAFFQQWRLVDINISYFPNSSNKQSSSSSSSSSVQYAVLCLSASNQVIGLSYGNTEDM